MKGDRVKVETSRIIQAYKDIVDSLTHENIMLNAYINQLEEEKENLQNNVTANNVNEDK